MAIVGIAAVMVVAVAGLALVLSGALGSHGAASPTPLTAAASPTAAPYVGAVTPPPTAAATSGPSATDEPTRTPRPTRRPVVTSPPTTEPTSAATPQPTRTPRPTRTPVSGTPSGAPAPDAFVCDASDSAIQDPLGQGWAVGRVQWQDMGDFDRVDVTLTQQDGGGNGTQAIIHVLPLNQVSTTLKVAAPQTGDVAVALGLFQDVNLSYALDRAVPLPAVSWVTVEKDDNGFPWIVLGVKGAGCYQLQVPAWTASEPQPASSIVVTIDVQH